MAQSKNLIRRTYKERLCKSTEGRIHPYWCIRIYAETSSKYKQHDHNFNNYDNLCYRSIYQFIRPTTKPTIMVLSSAQTNAFFEYLAHMGFPRPTVVYLQQEGIIIVNDISNFNKTTIKQLAVKLRFPAGHVKHPNRPDNVDAMIPTSTFVFGARSRTRLTISAKLVRYYDTVDCDITLSNMEWYQTVNNIQVQWKALDYKKNKDKPDVPEIKKHCL